MCLFVHINVVGHRSPVRSPEYSWDAEIPKQRGELFAAKSERSKKPHKTMNETRPKSVSSGKSSPIHGILDAMRSSAVEDNFR